jgi:cytochrome c-type biogenesis protein
LTPVAATVSADPLGFLVAFGAGILSFLSPCVLPLVPGYLSMVTGLEASELEAATGGPRPIHDEPDAHAIAGHGAGGLATATATATATASAVTAAPPTTGRPPITPLLRGILLFIAGFTVVFVALGAAASGLGHLLGTHKQALSIASGAIVILLGAVLLLGAVPATAWARLGSGPAGVAARVVGERRFSVRPSALGTWAAPVMGMAFAFAWTPCIGPVLGAITALAATRGTLAGGAGLLFAYSLGLGVPFLVVGLAFGRLTDVLGRARRGLWVVHLVCGVILIGFGILLVTGNLSWLAEQMQTLMRHVGLGRFTVS